jgi:putative copper resistance protein D
VLFLADFLDTLLRGAVLAGVSLALGGVAWQLWVVRPWQHRVPDAAVRRGLALLESGALVVAAGQALLLVLKALVLSDAFGPDAFGGFVVTLHFTAAAARILVALAVAGAVLWLRRAPDAASRWVAVAVLVSLLAASGAWLTHATGRVEYRAALMALTALHQVAAAVWIGGLAQLAAYWWLSRRRPAVDALWHDVVARFSRLAMASVVVAVLTALPLTWTYTGSIGGLVGTGYGALVLTKTMLLGAALLLATFNLRAARRAREPRAPAALRTRLPYLVEGEAILLVMILFTAATLSAQPPSVDQAAGDHATVGEVAEVFRPKLPSLHTPSVDIMRAHRAEAAARGERSRDAYLWSNYSHNVAGLILLAMSVVALVGSVVRPGGGRRWPLGFVALAAFVYLRAAANEGTWPFGPVPLWKIDAEGIQHRIAALLVLALGVLEWRARARPDRRSLLPYVFPALGAAGAVLLLTHSHAAFQSKQSFLVQVTHTTMGALAALLVVGRWLELRLAPPAARLAGTAATVAMLMIALVLVFYREANVLIPPD